jgi:uncharacterized protein (DUF58 family)
MSPSQDKISVHRLRMLVLLSLVSLVSGLITGRSLFYHLTYLFVSLIIFAFLWAWAGVSWVHLRRQTRARRAQVGRPLEERFAVRNSSILPKLWLEVRDESNLPGHLASHVVNALPPQQERAWTIRTICLERGRYTLGPITLYSGDPMGLFQLRRSLEHTSNIVVYPSTVEIASFPLPVGLLPGGDALRRRTHYITTNASGVRDYVPGDSFNRIHWRSTARRNRLIVKEFELDPLSDVWIFLDMSKSPHARLEIEETEDLGDMPFWMRPKEFKLPPSTEEYGVSAAASLAQHFLRRDRALGLVSYSHRREIIQADRGERQLTKVLETLAVLRAEGNVPFHEVIRAEAQQLARGTSVIIITPSSNLEWVVAARQMDRAGLRVVAIVIDAATFGGREKPANLATQLAGTGMMTYLIKCDDALDQVLSRQQGYLY